MNVPNGPPHMQERPLSHPLYLETLDDALDIVRHALRHATLPAHDWPVVEEAWEHMVRELGYAFGEARINVQPIRTGQPEPDDHDLGI